MDEQSDLCRTLPVIGHRRWACRTASKDAMLPVALHKCPSYAVEQSKTKYKDPAKSDIRAALKRLSSESHRLAMPWHHLNLRQTFVHSLFSFSVHQQNQTKY